MDPNAAGDDCLCPVGEYYRTTPLPAGCETCHSKCSACSDFAVCTSCTDPNRETSACTCIDGYYNIPGNPLC